MLRIAQRYKIFRLKLAMALINTIFSLYFFGFLLEIRRLHMWNSSNSGCRWEGPSKSLRSRKRLEYPVVSLSHHENVSTVSKSFLLYIKPYWMTTLFWLPKCWIPWTIISIYMTDSTDPWINYGTEIWLCLLEFIELCSEPWYNMKSDFVNRNQAK